MLFCELFFCFFRLCTLFNIAEFDVDDELPDDEEIERRFSTLLVSLFISYIKAANIKNYS